MRFSPKLIKVLRFLRNKYAITFIFFVVWVGFIDNRSLLERARLKSHVGDLKREIVFYEDLLHEQQERLKELKTNDSNLEKFAREQYMMKQVDEDVFVIVE